MRSAGAAIGADAVPAVVAANPGLAEAAPVLPAGMPIVFPDLPPASRAMPAGRLWDVAPPWIVLPEQRESDVRLGGVGPSAPPFERRGEGSNGLIRTTFRDGVCERRVCNPLRRRLAGGAYGAAWLATLRPP